MTARRLRFEIASFTTDPELCPYLHDRPAEQSVRVVTQLSPAEYSQLLAAGWRRFGSVLFRPACGSCSECVPLRVLVKRFRPSKSQRRVLRRNADVEVEISEPRCDEERMTLYRRFHSERAHSRGWPYRELERDEYVETFVENPLSTLEFQYRWNGKLIGVAYVGEASDAFNSIYAFTDPSHARRGLGNLDVLTEIAEAERRGKLYLYLGFHIADCPSMAYKSAFRPYQLLIGGSWRLGGWAGASPTAARGGGEVKGTGPGGRGC